MQPTNPVMYPIPMCMDVGQTITPDSARPNNVMTCVVACKAIGHCVEGILVQGENGEPLLSRYDERTNFVERGVLSTPPRPGMTRTECFILGQWVRTHIRDMPGKSVVHTDDRGDGCDGCALILFSDQTYWKVRAEDEYGMHILNYVDLTLRDLKQFELVTDEDWASHEGESKCAAIAEQERSGRRLLAQAIQFMGRQAIREAVKPTVLEEEVSLWEREAQEAEDRRKSQKYVEAVRDRMANGGPRSVKEGETVAEALDREVEEALQPLTKEGEDIPN